MALHMNTELNRSTPLLNFESYIKYDNPWFQGTVAALPRPLASQANVFHPEAIQETEFSALEKKMQFSSQTKTHSQIR